MAPARKMFSILSSFIPNLYSKFKEVGFRSTCTPTIQLLGPPSIDRAQLLSVIEHGGGETNSPPIDNHVGSLSTQWQGSKFNPNPLMGFTENFSATFLSTGNPCLDFFFHVVPDTPPQELIERLDVAWAHNPLTTLKLICNLRGVRGTGKSDKEGFYLAALWLHYNHPKTLSGNLKAFVEFGYFKDFLEILYRILEGPFVRKFEKEQRMEISRRRRSRRMDDEDETETGSEETEDEEDETENDGENHEENHEENDGEKHEKKEKIKKTSEELMAEKEEARVLRKQRELNKAVKGLEK